MTIPNGSMLSVRDLRTGFGVHAVLHGVGLDAKEGEITAILGLNGAGKSVTLKTISGLIDAWSGSIVFNGKDVTNVETEDRVAAGMAHVLQGRAVFPHLTVEENLRLGGAVIKDKKAVASAIEGIYERFPRLGERRSQAGGSLSGGEQEMLAVGRALMASPRLILVDEASQGLAPIAVEHLFQTLKEVNASGVTILMVEQNVAFTLAIADRVLVMQRGEIVYEGEAADLDRDRLAELLGIGALLGRKAMGSSEQTPSDSVDQSLQEIAKPLPRRRVKPPTRAALPRRKPAPRSKPAARAPAKKPAAPKRAKSQRSR